MTQHCSTPQRPTLHANAAGSPRPHHRSLMLAAVTAVLGICAPAATAAWAQSSVTSEPSFTISQALTRALAKRPMAAAAHGVADRARGAGRVAALIPNPVSSLQYDRQSPTLQLTLEQQLGWLARRRADVSLRSSLSNRGAIDSVQVMATLAQDVQRAFYAALASRERMDLVTQQSSLADSLVLLAERRVTAGDISVLERNQVALEASRARLLRGQVHELNAVATAEFSRAIAWAGSEPPRPDGILHEGLNEAMGAADGIDLNTLPRLQVALLDSAAAKARYQAARIDRLPIPTLIAGVQWGTASGGIAPSPRQNPIIGFSVPFPLFNQGSEIAQQTRGAAIEASAFAAEARLTARAQLTAAHARVIERSERAQFARDSLLPDAQRIRAGAVRLYEAGQTGVLPVLDALRIEREVAQTVVAELLAFQEARADLNVVLGRWP